MTTHVRDVWPLYHRHADAFDRARLGSTMERGWLDALCAQLNLPGAAILDIGCGTGEPIAADLIRRGARLTGVDAAPAMIDRARTRFPDHDWHVADMRNLDLRARFDAVIAWDSFFHLPRDDQPATLARLAAHGRPGAPLMFTSGPENGEAIGDLFGEPLFHASLAPAEYRAILAAAGCAVVRYVPNDPGCGGHTVWLTRKHEAAP